VVSGERPQWNEEFLFHVESRKQRLHVVSADIMVVLTDPMWFLELLLAWAELRKLQVVYDEDPKQDDPIGHVELAITPEAIMAGGGWRHLDPIEGWCPCFTTGIF
jgi:hypothetical protein